MKKPKQSYHSDIIIQYKLGLLPIDLKEQIPSSTLFNWKNKDLNKLFGYKGFSISEERINLCKSIYTRHRFYQACRILDTVFRTYDSIIGKLKNKKCIFRKSKDIIVPSVEKIASIAGLKRSLRWFGISYQQFHTWKGKLCTSSPVLLCFKKHPLQISSNEIHCIKKYFHLFPSWDKKAVYYKMLKDGVAFMSLSSWYKYANRLGITSSNPGSRRKKHSIGIRAAAPKQIIHMDVTVFRPLDHSRIYIYLIVDNFSRHILGWQASRELKCSIALQTLKDTCINHNLFNNGSHVDLIVDGDSENNCCSLNNFIQLNKDVITKLVAQKDILFSNAMVEASHKNLKYGYLFRKELMDFEDTIKYLPYAINDHSNKPHGTLFGLTPSEVLNGAVPDKYLFKSRIAEARGKRILTNRAYGCGKC